MSPRAAELGRTADKTLNRTIAPRRAPARLSAWKDVEKLPQQAERYKRRTSVLKKPQLKIARR